MKKFSQQVRSTPLRVLFLHRHADEKGIGGVMEYLHYLPLFLKRNGVQTFLYRERKNSSEETNNPIFFQNGMPVYSGPFPKPSFIFSAKKLKEIIDLCHREKIGLIHAQGTYRSGYLAMQVYKHTGIPYIVTSHSDIAPNSGRMKRKKVLKYCQNILKNASHVTHLSPPMAEFSHRIYPTHDKSTLIGNGIDLSEWHSSKTFSEQNYLLALGRFEVEKGFHILIDAYAQLYNKGANISLVLAGAGSAEAMFFDRVKQHGLPLVKDLKNISTIPERSVVFTGYVRGEIKRQLIEKSKMILFSTLPALYEEPFGIVQIEAMAAGKPLVASDSAVTRYLKTLGLQALLVEPDSASHWAEQISNLLDDHFQREQLGKKNLENASQFDWDFIAKQYKDVYLKTVLS